MVLCVGTDDKFLEQAKSYLERTAGVQVRIATSPQDAMAWMRNERYDAIVCDHRSPTIASLDFLGGLRASGMDVPFVLLTEEDREQIMMRAMHLDTDFHPQTTQAKEYMLPELNHRLCQAMEMHDEENRLHHRLVMEELRQEMEKFRAIANYACNMEIWIGTDGEMRWLNPAVEKITGYSVAECMRVPSMLLPMVVEEDRPLIAEWQKKAEMGESLSDQELRIRRKDGELRHVAVSWQPIFDSFGNPLGQRVSARDVTERRKVEEALQQSFAQLTTLNRVTRHDMAAQIAVLKKGVELCQSSTEAKTERLLERMASTVSELERQLQFMEDYQQLGANEPMWQNVSEVASSVLEKMVLPSHVKVKLDLGDLEVFADPMLEKVFASLVDNSLLHGGGVRNLRLHNLATDDGVSIVYQDDGKGIPDQEKPMLFQSRYDKRPALGLLLCRSILEVTGIEIRENGTSGKGARFDLVVPAGFFRFPPAEER